MKNYRETYVRKAEIAQLILLHQLYSLSGSRDLIFQGGTALRWCYGGSRFSEDLDFDNRGLTQDDFSALTQGVAKKLALEGYVIQTSTSFKGAFSADIKVMGVLFDEGLSGHQDEKILIKLDAQPQNFKYSAQRVVINKFDVFTGISVVPVDILLAQKFYAILARKRAMGRDFYDAVFLAGTAKSDFAYLKERAGIADKEMLKLALLERCAKLDFKLLSRDVEQFIFFPKDAKKVLLFMEYVREW